MVAKFLDLNNPSWQRRPFALSNDWRSRNNARESRTFHAIHVRFFLSNLQICVPSLSCKELYHGHLASWLWRDRVSKRGNRLGESRKQKTKQNKLNCCSAQLYGVLDSRCLACVQTSPASSGKNRERRRFFPEGGGDVCTQTNRCLSLQWGMKGTTQASGADSTSAGTCWHNVYKQDSGTW